ncbi:aspartyl/asparaginyl beta-hydroxylase domain-containing protein [Geminocystis sp. GBBB08]|uniref:aspartyl/asparaginyl beta-hydroxylase domain-containing protein n=1 Tax=Geminocystis sp. GBBB08 TaxID=2604140 RepID=UPI0027E31076|nr:aspartyl/asparaginyl beta-hydroxylase domain-containing protein [Geminocystis sp. GBBB08]MBL1209297.1 aspartyl/asparaginyl beta-hydroxylase domain-containing protein [Geminocystis sp. GBBB08]
MIEANTLLNELLKGNHHKGGIKCLKLFKVKENFFTNLSNEVIDLIKTNQPSNVQSKEHISNWSNPYGDVMQFSLLNHSGKFDDTSTDHDLQFESKSFHYQDQYPYLAQFTKTFPHAYNMRIMGLGKKSGLSPHEEHIVVRHRQEGSKNYYSLRARFHLPIITNEQAQLLIEDEIYHFAVGNIYFFNNGCIHSAYNLDSQPRYHLIWDMLVTESTFELMFSDSTNLVANFLEKMIGDNKKIAPLRTEKITEYQVMGRSKELYDLLKLNLLGIKPYMFNNLWNEWAYFQHNKLGELEFFKI